jgi:hypothetical protein
MLCEIIDYIIRFSYESINNVNWVDNFEVNKEWPIIKLKTNRIVEKKFMNKTYYNKPKQCYDILLNNKNRWIYLYNNEGSTTVSNINEFYIPNLKINKIRAYPYNQIFKFKYNIQVLLLIIEMDNRFTIIEKSKIDVVKWIVIYKKCKMEIYENVIAFKSYKEYKHKEFNDFCEIVYELYSDSAKKYLKLFSKLDKRVPEPNMTHKSLAYKTWYKAKRENQGEWPYISNKYVEGSIEFPIGSGIYYYHDKYKVYLGRRNDDNDEIYIPKTYKRQPVDKTNRKLLPSTINNYNDYKISKIYNNINITNEPYIEISYNGKIIEAAYNSRYVVYDNSVVKRNVEIDLPIGIKAQLLDKTNNRIKVLKEKWENNPGPKIKGIITLPWYYKQIIHDYNKLGRLKDGPLMDLSNIGIVNKHGVDIITYPLNGRKLYVGKCLETHRLLTLKYQKNCVIDYV